MKSSECFPYREAVGALAYLMVASRPDTSYAVGVASLTLEHPSKEDSLRHKRIIRYALRVQSLTVSATRQIIFPLRLKDSVTQIMVEIKKLEDVLKEWSVAFLEE